MQATKNSVEDGSPRRDTLTILQRIAANESGAFDDCITRYRGLVWSIVRRFVRDHAEAEDAVQEIFVALWSAAGKFDPAIAGESTFVGMIARRKVIDGLRRRSRQPATDTIDDSHHELPGARSAGVFEGSPDATKAKDIIREMPINERAAVTMSLHYGFSHTEISDRLSLPLGTVKTYIRRGMARVRDEIEATPRLAVA